MDILLDSLTRVRDSVAFNLQAIDREITDYKSIKNPSPTDALRTQGMVSYYGGNYAQVRPIFNALVALEPSERNLVKLSQIEHRLGNFDQAYAVASRAVHAYQNSFPALEMLAITQLSLAQYNRASETADKALAIRPNAPRVSAIKALALHLAEGRQHSITTLPEFTTIGSNLQARILDLASDSASASSFSNILSDRDLILGVVISGELGRI